MATHEGRRSYQEDRLKLYNVHFLVTDKSCLACQLSTFHASNTVMLVMLVIQVQYFIANVFPSDTEWYN